MADNFNQLLDMCLDRIAAGEDMDGILADYPADAARLRPLLQTATRTSRTFSYSTNPKAKRAAKQRFDTALVTAREYQRLRQPWFRRYLLRPAALAAAATVIVGLLVVFTSVQTALSPGSYQVSPVIPVANSNGNFVFLISDDVNAITDFKSVVVDISKIGLQQADGKWVEIDPTATAVDLTEVPGDAVKEIWHGDIPPGEYNQVFVYVDNVTGILEASGQSTEIKLPSEKLHLSIPFTISDDSVTSFTYDMTVFATGNGKNSKYILKPQVGESGTQQVPRDIPDKENSTIPNQPPINTPAKPSKTPKK